MAQEINRTIVIMNWPYRVNGAVHENGEFYGDATATVARVTDDGYRYNEVHTMSVSKRHGKVHFQHYITRPTNHGGDLIAQDDYFPTYAAFMASVSFVEFITQ